MSFDPKKHVIRVQGNREYLPVSARLVWFRQEHPDWSIVTTPVEINLEKQYAIFSASIMNAEGKIVATGTKMENIKGFGDFIEKAETGSVGRALAMCGYGTQFAPELEEGNGRFSDAPIGPSANRFGARPNSNGGGFNNRPAPMRPNGGMNGNNGEGGPRPPAPMSSSIAEDESPFESAATARPVAQTAPPVRSAEVPSPPNRPAPVPQEPRPVQNSAVPRPAMPPVQAASGGIQRVREPERDFSDPGGDDEPENPDDDLFLSDDFAPAPPVNRAAPQRPQQALQPVAEAAPPKPNPLAGNAKCTVPGCTAVLTPAQMTLSMQKFGRPICVLHQRDASVTGADNRSQNASAL